MGAIEKQDSLNSESEEGPLEVLSSECWEDASDQIEVVEADANAAKGWL